MYGWMLLGCTALALRQIYRYLSSEDQYQVPAHANGYRTSETYRNRDPPFGSPSSRNSGGNNNDPLRQSDQNPPRYYENYPNTSNSTPRSSTNRPSSSASATATTTPVPSSSSPQFNPPASSSPSQSNSPASSSSSQYNPPAFSSSSSSQSNPPASSSQYNPPAFSSSSQSNSPASSSSSQFNPPVSPTSPQSNPPLYSSSYEASSSSSKTLPSSKPTLSLLYSDSTNQHTKQANYVRVDQKDTSPIYMIPKEIENLIKNDIVPGVLKMPLSPSTYKDYFAALLYAEDFYVEKWNDYQLSNVTLELHEAAIYDKPLKNKNLKGRPEKDDKIFVAFEIDSVPERRPFLLFRDFVYARRSGSEGKKFQGIVYRVVKSTKVLVEFEEEFYSQHHGYRKYDISFSFNRVCLKRAHQAISAASGPLFNTYIFPDHAIRKNTSADSAPVYSNYNLDMDSKSAVHHILNFKGSPPYLVEGPLCTTSGIGQLSKTGLVVREAVLQIYQRSSKSRILICSPLNRTGDISMRSLKKEIPESGMLRANAAFRGVDGVPVDILPFCVIEGECFSVPSVKQLKKFNVIFSTFVSSFRLSSQGITTGHFSHIFLVDASSATEPETMIPLSNFANEKTSVRATEMYRSYDRTFFTQL